MADISKITIESGTYDIKDAVARNKINQVVNPKSYQNKKYLLVGDSYAVGYQGSGIDNIEGFFTKLVNNLSLNAQIVCANGYGFLGMNGSLKWKDLIQNTTINNKETFTDIIICGGMNDRDIDENIQSAMEECFTYLHSNFINATIHVGCIGRYAKQSTEQNIVNQRRISTLYKVITVKNGNKYINNSELVLHNMSWFISDDIHPNTYGENQLAYAMEQYIVNGTITNLMSLSDLNDFQRDTFSPASGVSYNGNMYSYMNDRITTFYFDGAFGFNTAIDCNNLNDIKLGKLTNSYVCGSAYGQGIDEFVTGYVYSTTPVNGSNFVKVNFRLYNDCNNDLWVKPFTVKDDGGINSLSITEITFPYSSIKCNADSRYC